MNCISWDRNAARVISVPIPDAIPKGYILVQVFAFSIGRFDVEDVYQLSRYTNSRKEGLGGDFSGIVKAVGTECTIFEPGDAVMGVVLNFCTDTTGAEYIVVAESLCTRKPSNTTHAEVVSVLFDALLAERTLRLVKACDTDSILISGGSSNLARILIQLGKSSMFGVEWIASTVSQPSDRSYAESVGADETFDITCNSGDWSLPFETGVNRKEYEVVIDIVGDSKHCKKLVNSHEGRFVSLFNKPTPEELFDFNIRTGSKWLNSGGFFLRNFGNVFTSSLGRSRKFKNYFSVLPSGDGEILERISVLLETGSLTPQIEKKFALSEVQLAVDAVRREPFARGRVVVEFS